MKRAEEKLSHLARSGYPAQLLNIIERLLATMVSVMFLILRVLWLALGCTEGPFLILLPS